MGLKIKGYGFSGGGQKKTKNRDLSFWLVGQENKKLVGQENKKRG